MSRQETGFEYDANGYTFNPAPGEEPDAIILVHGIHPPLTSPDEAYPVFTSTADTVYKRLWHAGYRGRFVFYKWPALNPGDVGIGGLHLDFNKSEARAWAYGRGLAQLAADQPSGYRRHIFAHSQGNAVAGAAFREFGLQARTWIITQGAIPISCFDANLSHYVFNYTTPDLANDFGYRGLLSGRVNSRVVNFFNEADSVTGSTWELNHRVLKPEKRVLNPLKQISYYYQAVTDEIWWQEELPTDGSRVGYRVAVTDLYESMSFVAKSRSRSIGHGRDAYGEVDARVDLPAEFGFGDVHGSQWSNSIQENVLPYYLRMIDETKK